MLNAADLVTPSHFAAYQQCQQFSLHLISGDVCPEEEDFFCDRGECISSSFACDGESDCSNGIDEKNCTKGGCINFLSKAMSD